MPSRTLRLALALVVATLAGSAVAADNATVNGLVTDATGSRIVGAKVTLTNLNTNVETDTTTNDVGFYSVGGLQPGMYRVEVSKQGFKGIIKSGVELHVQDVVGLNFALQVGSVSESITVEGGAPLVNTESSAVGTIVEREFIANMPLNGRSFQSLISLTPGAVAAVSSGNSPGQFSMNGQRPDANYFTIDGVSANVGIGSGGSQGPQGGGSGVQLAATGGYNNLVSVDAVQEFKIETSTFNAEYGRLPGAQISIVTRPGTNSFHGSAFDYFRNDVLDANNWFNDHNVPVIKKPPERQNDYGGVFGGPLIKNKLFFFGSYEGLRLKVPQSITTGVPSLCARGGGGCVTVNGVTGRQAAAGTLPFVLASPPPNQPQCTSGTTCDPNVGTFVGAFSNENKMDVYSLRLDWHPTSKQSFFARGNDAPTRAINHNGTGGVANLLIGTKTLTLGHDYIFSPRLTNDIHYNYSYVTNYSTNTREAFAGAVVPDDSLMFFGQYNRFNAAFTFSGRNIPAISVGALALARNRQYQIIDSMSWVVGSHQLKFGLDWRRIAPEEVRAPYQQNLGYNTTTAQWINNTLATYSVSAFPPKVFWYHQTGSYVQDTWKVTRRLTLNLGVRWDVNPPPDAPAGAHLLALNHVDFSSLSTTHVLPDGAPIYQTQWNAFAPRIGLAYQLSTSANWGRVIRAGYGLFYDTGGVAAGFSERPFIANTTANPGPWPVPATLQTRPTLPTAPPWGFVTTVDPSFQLPYTHQANLAFEQQLGAKQVVTATYAGAFARSLVRRNQYPLSLLNSDFPQGMYAMKNDSWSNYNALQVQYQRRLYQGLQAMASYTWSHSLDTGSSQVGTSAIAPNLVPVQIFYGNSEFDIRHSFQTAVLYNVPSPSHNRIIDAVLGHWGLDTLFRARTAPPIELVESNVYFAQANPFTATCSPTPCVPATTVTNTGGIKFSIRPNLVPGQPVWITDSTVGGYKRLNPAAFQLLAANTLVTQEGTLGRNELRGFGFEQVDFTLRREFPIHESVKLQFRSDFFNLFNTPSFMFPLNSTSLDVTNALFGRVTSTLNNALIGGGVGVGFSPQYQVGGPRSIQFSLKLLF